MAVLRRRCSNDNARRQQRQEVEANDITTCSVVKESSGAMTATPPTRKAAIPMREPRHHRADPSNSKSRDNKNSTMMIDHPTIHRGVVRPRRVKVHQPLDSDDTMETTPPKIFLMRKEECAERAYALIPGKTPVYLEHFGGKILYGMVYRRLGDANIFEAPAPDKVEYVAIKQLNKAAVDEYLDAGGHEDPYRDLARMQELGDDDHVLSCMEALEDDEYLYIVTSKPPSDNDADATTLADAIPWGSTDSLDADVVRDWFQQILRILAYLESHGICHLDLSPDNFLFLKPNKLVAFDLASSLRIPVDNNGKRVYMGPHDGSSHSSLQYVAPEVFRGHTFDGPGADLWSAAVILYNMLTNQVLYHIPNRTDLSFKYLIGFRALTSVKQNERTVKILTHPKKSELEEFDRHDLLSKAMAHLDLTPQAMELFDHVLREDPRQRWSLQQTLNSAFVRGKGLPPPRKLALRDRQRSKTHAPSSTTADFIARIIQKNVSLDVSDTCATF